MTLTKHIHNYLAHLRDDRALADRSVQGYGYELLLFARVVGLDAQVKKIQHEQVLSFVNRPAPDGSPIRPTSRNRKLAVARGFFRYLVEQGIIRKQNNPIKEIKWARVPQVETPCLIWEDYKILLAMFEGEEELSWLQKRDRVVIQALFHTGVRVTELASIVIGQIDLDACVSG